VSVADDLRGAFLTSSLSDEQLDELIAAGHERSFAAGDDLFREGTPAEDLWILLEGEIELTRRIGNQSTVVARMSNPGQWAGGLTAWGPADGHSVYRASGRAITAGRCFLVPSTELSTLVERWSPFAKHMISGIYNTVRGIDAIARERESLVALGTLAARLAHEINNPASAALRAVESLRNAARYMLVSLVDLAELGTLAEDFLALDRLRAELQETPVVATGAIATSDREEMIGMWMEDHDIPVAWQLAPVMAGTVADRAWLDALEERFGEAAMDPSLRWISSTIGMTTLLDELTEATSRIHNLIADVKTYSQVDRAALQHTDVRAGIRSTVAMFGPKAAGIDVVYQFADDTPEIDAYASELNQVWTNLIDNAIDAMGGSGTLRIATHADGDHLVVEVTDSGPGMDPEVLARAFEPFYTTKDVGKGTGLGLDISRRIVIDRHGGDISFQSEPGRTTARVRLPIGS